MLALYQCALYKIIEGIFASQNRKGEAMKKAFMLCLIVVSVHGLSDAQVQESNGTARRGLVTTGSCPYSCKIAGLAAEQCREWTDGATCSVEDFTQPAGHRSMFRVKAVNALEVLPKDNRAQLGTERRGLVTSSNCPYTCKMANLPADQCREWTDGQMCYVEDFSQPPGHRSRVGL